MKTNRPLYLCIPCFLLLCASFFLAGCSKDEEGTGLPDCVANVTITTRGIVVNPPTDNNLDDYVKSIRVIAFNAEGSQVWNKLYTAQTAAGVIQWNQQAVQLEAQLTPGIYTLYVIANEDGHNLASNASNADKVSLTAELTKTDQAKKPSLTSTELENLVIEYQEPKAESPILMTAKKQVVLFEGDNSFTIPLVRTLAKLSRVNVAKGDYPYYGEHKDPAKDPNNDPNTPPDKAEVQSLQGSFTLTVKMMDRFSLFGNETTSAVQPATTKTVTGTLATDMVGQYFPPTAILIDNLEATPTGDKKYTLVKNEKSQFPVSRNEALILNAKIMEASCLQLNIGYQEWIPKELGPTYE